MGKKGKGKLGLQSRGSGRKAGEYKPDIFPSVACKLELQKTCYIKLEKPIEYREQLKQIYE